MVKQKEYIGINDYFIDLADNKQLFYGLIYNLKLVEVEILKTYIEINLANEFIQLFEFLAYILIFIFMLIIIAKMT